MSKEVAPEHTGSGETRNENLGPDDSSNPNLRASIIMQISEKQSEITRVRHKRKKLSKKHRQTAEMLTYLCSLASDMHRVQSPDPGAGMEELEEKHRAITESALSERQLLLEQYTRQYDQVNRLIGTNDEQKEGANNPELRSLDADATSNPDNISFVQPTPEREENLEEYLRNRSVRSSPPRARQELFNARGKGSLSEQRAEIAARKRELRSLETERDEMVRQCGEIDAGRDEGLLSEVRHEREKYASLLEERRLLEETQDRVSQRMASPGPPPMPDYDRLRHNSDMEITSMAGNAYLHADPAQGLPEYYLPQEPQYEPRRPHINPSYSLPVVLPEAAQELYPLTDRDWQEPEATSVRHPTEQFSVLHEISDKLSLLLQQRDETQQQQHQQYQHQQEQHQQQQQEQQRALQTPQLSYPIYTPSLGPVPPATTPLPYQFPQFTSYPPNTPGVELPAHLYPTNSHQFYPSSSSLPPYLSSYPPPVTPSPFPSYPPLPSYLVPPPYYQPTTPYVYQSLPTPVPPQPPNQWTQTIHYPPPPQVQPTASATPLPPPLLVAPSQDMNVPLTVSCTQTDLTFLENPLSSHHMIQEHEAIPIVSETRRELPRIPPRRETHPVPLPPPSSSAPLPENPAPPQLRPAPQASPLFEQVRDQLYSEVASLLSENEARPYYLMELLRAAQLLKTDYLREAGVSSLKRVINNYLNQDQIDSLAFSALPSEENPVHSPTQNFPLARHYLNTDLSGSSENAGERCPSRNFQWTQELQQELGYLQQEAQSDISEITTSDLSYSRASPWEQQVRDLVTRLIPVLRDHLDQRCDPKLLALIHQHVLVLLSELFPAEMVLRVRQRLESELKEILSKYRASLLRDCGEELVIDVSDLFFAQMDNLVSYNSMEFSNETDGEDSEREGRDQARDDALAAATGGNENETICLSDSTRDSLVVLGHQCKDAALLMPPTLSPPNIINLTLSESRPIADDVTSERSEDYSQSKTVDTISETASCTASDLSDANMLCNHVHEPVDSNSSSENSRQSAPPVREEESDGLPPFASVSLAQGSFTLLNRGKEPPVEVLDFEDNNNFIPEVMSLGDERLELTGEMLEILPPSSH